MADQLDSQDDDLFQFDEAEFIAAAMKAEESKIKKEEMKGSQCKPSGSEDNANKQLDKKNAQSLKLATSTPNKNPNKDPKQMKKEEEKDHKLLLSSKYYGDKQLDEKTAQSLKLAASTPNKNPNKDTKQKEEEKDYKMPVTLKSYSTKRFRTEEDKKASDLQPSTSKGHVNFHFDAEKSQPGTSFTSGAMASTPKGFVPTATVSTPTVMPGETACTPVARISPPAGYIVMSTKWLSSPLAAELKLTTPVMYMEDMGIVDFYASKDCALVYFSASDLVDFSLCKRNVVKSRNLKIPRTVIIAEERLSNALFISKMQQFVVVQLKMSFLAIASEKELPQLLTQFINGELKIEKNVIRVHSNSHTPLREEDLYPPHRNLAMGSSAQASQNVPMEQSFLKEIMRIPGVNPSKAQELVMHYKSRKAIANQSFDDLVKVVGKAAAEAIYLYFQDNPREW